MTKIVSIEELDYYAHLSKMVVEDSEGKKEFLKENDPTWIELEQYLDKVGSILNDVSGVILNKGTHMGIVGDDQMLPQFRALEENYLIERWVTIRASTELEEQIRKYADEMKQKRRK
jgi:hypothetical protein